jgi:hypothetical protein
MYLLLSLITVSALNAQKTNAMKNQQEAAKGEIITKGKLLYTEIRINASAETVWSVLTDFEKYPDWNPFIRSLQGGPEKGKKIDVLLQAPQKKVMRFKPRVLQFEKEKEFRWIGKLILPRLFDGEHTFKVTANGDGTCTFLHYERFRGMLVPLLKHMLDKNTRQGFEQMNAAMKKRCEGK